MAIQDFLAEYQVNLKDPQRPKVKDMTPCDRGEGNVYSSEHRYDAARHLPLFDFDEFAVELVPSSTAGNSHLYIGKPITWEQYCNILDAFFEAGLLQEGFVKMTKARGAAFLRKPGVMKEADDVNSGEGWVV